MAHEKIPPVLVAGAPADFTPLSPDGFEEFCVALVRVQKGVQSADKHGTRGQADKAVDVLARREDGALDLYQCKNYKEYTVNNLDDHIAEFLRNLATWQASGTIVRYVLMISSKLEITQIHAAITRHTASLLSHGIALQVWSGGNIETRLAPHPQIVRRFFDEWWVGRLCNPSSVAKYDLLENNLADVELGNALAANQQSLQGLLASLPINIAKIRSLFQQITHCETSAADTIASMLHALDDYPLAKAELSNTDLLVVRLATMCQHIAAQGSASAKNSPAHQAALEKLEQWLDAGPRKYAAPAIIAEQERLAEQQVRAESAPIIVLQPFAEHGARGWCFGDGQWGSEFSLPVPDGAVIEHWLADALGTVAAQFGIGSDTIIELVLPWQNLFARCVGVKIEPIPDICFQIGESGLVLVLRLQERWQVQAWHNNWRRQWQFVQTKLATVPEVRIHPTGKPACADRWHWLATSHAQANSSEFKKALFNGTPFALWCAPEDIDFIKEKFTQCNYLEFHQHFQGFGNLRDSASHIHCLIDDPDRIPPGASDQENQFRQPPQRT